MKLLLLSGSFHSKSRSMAILNNINDLLESHDTKLLKLDVLPFYSEDLNNDKPESVCEFLEEVKHADGIIFCTPEYNHSIPAVLKNAIDWASRPAFNSSLKDMPVTFITQAVSPVGGARAQAHLKLVLDSTLSKIHTCHEMMISHVNEIFNEDMKITDNRVNERLLRHINDFINFSQKEN